MTLTLLNPHKLWPKFSVLLLIVFAGLGCATTRKTQEIRLIDAPPTVGEMFQSCHSLDGAFAVTVARANQKTLFFDMEFQTVSSEQRLPDSWTVEASDPTAQTIAQLKFDASQRSISISSRYSDTLPRFSIDKENFLFIDGEFIGIKVDEWPCFLKKRIPIAWMVDKLNRNLQDKHTFENNFSDSMRDIKSSISLATLDNEKTTSVCHTITWSRYIGIFRQKIEFCNRYIGESSSGTISVLDFRIDWVDIDP